MGKFGAWLLNFMQGRYGFDQFGRALSVVVVVIWIISIIIGVFSNLFGIWAALISTILNWIGLIVLAFMLFRVFSRNFERRRAENEWYLRRTSKGNQSKDIFNNGGNSGGAQASPSAEDGYKYLSCSFCGQQMRVPAGKGKIAVKCPSCGEKTIVSS